MKRCAFFLASILLLAAPAAASEERFAIDGQIVPGANSPRDEAVVRWSLSGDGQVSLRRTICPQCAGIDSHFYRFAVEPALMARIEALLPGDVIEAATNAPCRLPHAETGWATRVSVRAPEKHGWPQTRTFFDTCESLELAALRARMSEATGLLLAEIARRDIQPEP